MTNRVDELESEIAELRAAVNGLTEELVETKARVRELEAESEADAEASDTETDFVDADPVAPTSETTKSDDHVEVVEQEPSTESGATSFEDDNPAETKESTDDATEQGDIIVA